MKEYIDVQGVPYAWELEARLTATLSTTLSHARNFSEILHGAQLLYNLILAEQSNNSDRKDE
jgi:hypothetical protein